MKWIELKEEGLLFTEEDMKGNPELAKVVALNDHVNKSLQIETGSQPVEKQEPVINPCLTCALKGLCDSDDCGNHLFPLDVPTTKFSNLGEYIDFIKHYDWL